MALNGYIPRDAAEAAKAEDLLTVQGGAVASARSDMPPRDYFTDEIRRQLSAKLGDEELFTGGLIIRATVNPEYQAVAAQALRDGLERYDRGLRVYRGPVAQVDPAGFDAADEASWRRALSAAAVPRDIDGWHPALILSIGEASARIGIEGVPEDEDGHFLSYEEASWGRVRDENGRLRASEGPDDLWDVGDVDLRQGGRGRRLVVPADPGDPGRVHGDGHPDRPGPRHAGRLLLPVERLQPRDPGAAPAGIVVQALRLCRRARQRLQPRHHRARRADRGGDRRPASGRRRTRAAPTTARRRSAPASSSRAT